MASQTPLGTLSSPLIVATKLAYASLLGALFLMASIIIRMAWSADWMVAKDLCIMETIAEIPRLAAPPARACLPPRQARSLSQLIEIN